MKLTIPKTANTPQIIFDEGVLTISGRSIPENAVNFFQPLFKSIAEYTNHPCPLTQMNILLEYANSSTNRSLLTIFTLAERIVENGNTLIVNWYYEAGDEIMYELGNDFKSILHIPFAIKEREFC